MTFIEGEITIARPAETVFDFAADQRNEPRYNPRMVRAEKVTGGPVGKGTVFRSAVRAAGRATEMRSELTGYHRPGWLASRTTDGAGGHRRDADLRAGARRDADALGVGRPAQGYEPAADPSDQLDRPPSGARDLDRHEAVPGSSPTVGEG